MTNSTSTFESRPLKAVTGKEIRRLYLQATVCHGHHGDQPRRRTAVDRGHLRQQAHAVCGGLGPRHRSQSPCRLQAAWQQTRAPTMSVRVQLPTHGGRCTELSAQRLQSAPSTQ
jgi:hypothetical protein